MSDTPPLPRHPSNMPGAQTQGKRSFKTLL
jgi:hypothetical protein